MSTIKTLNRGDHPDSGQAFINAVNGKTYTAITIDDSKGGNPCAGCAFDNTVDMRICLHSPDCVNLIFQEVTA